MDERVKILKDVVRHPSDAFEEIGEGGEKYLPGALAILIFIFLLPYLFLPGFFPLRFTMGSLIVPLYIVLIYFIGGVLGGEAGFRGLVSALGYAYIPSIFTSVVFGISARANMGTIKEVMALKNLPKEQVAEKAVPLLKELVTPTNISLGVAALVLGVWGFVLTVYACRETHKFSTRKALGTIILTMVAVSVITNFFGFLV